MLKEFVLKIWRELPSSLQLFIARLVRPNYRVAVAAFIFDEQMRLLLCEHKYRKKYPWGLPAGSLEHGESPEAAVVREVLEETGLEVEIEKMLLAESAVGDHHISLIYLCRNLGGSFQPNLETSQTKYFEVKDLPNVMPTEGALIQRVMKMIAL